MKSQGIICSSQPKQTGQHAFHFSLRSLQTDKKRRLDISVDFTPNIFQFDLALKEQKPARKSTFDPSNLLPSFTKGSQKKFNAFLSTAEHTIFQQENKAIVSKLVHQSQVRKESSHQIMQAVPKSNFCQICKETFSDYLKHLNHPVHIKNFEHQCKNTMVDDLIKSLQDKDQSFRRNRRCVDDQQVEQHNIPSKIRVIQLQDTLTPMRMNCSNISINRSGNKSFQNNLAHLAK